MQADEQVRMMRLGKHDAIQQWNIHVIRAREKNLPAFLFKQWREPPGPIEREFLFKPSVKNAVRAAVDSTMAWVNDNDTVVLRRRKRRFAQQRLQIFLQVQPVHKNLIVNDLRFEAEIDLDAVPGRVAAAYFQKHHAVGRTNRIRGDWQTRQQVRSADAVLRGPTVQ